MKRLLLFPAMAVAMVAAEPPAISFNVIHYNKAMLSALSRSMPAAVVPKMDENIIAFVRIADPTVTVFQMTVRFTDGFGAQRSVSRSCDRDQRPGYISSCTVFLSATKINSVTITPLKLMEAAAVTVDQDQ